MDKSISLFDKQIHIHKKQQKSKCTSLQILRNIKNALSGSLFHLWASEKAQCVLIVLFKTVCVSRNERESKKESLNFKRFLFLFSY